MRRWLTLQAKARQRILRRRAEFKHLPVPFVGWRTWSTGQALAYTLVGNAFKNVNLNLGIVRRDGGNHFAILVKQHRFLIGSDPSKADVDG